MHGRRFLPLLSVLNGTPFMYVTKVVQILYYKYYKVGAFSLFLWRLFLVQLVVSAPIITRRAPFPTSLSHTVLPSLPFPSSIKSALPFASSLVHQKCSSDSFAPFVKYQHEL